MVFVAQDQALRTNWIKKNIDDQEISAKCRLSGERDESITHPIAECKKLAQKDYKELHDSVARIVPLGLYQKAGLIGDVKWYNHKPKRVMENERVKILWDFNIQTDHQPTTNNQHRRPDIVIVYKKERKCQLIDIAIPGDSRVELKEHKKVDNYNELK